MSIIDHNGQLIMPPELPDLKIPTTQEEADTLMAMPAYLRMDQSPESIQVRAAVTEFFNRQYAGQKQDANGYSARTE